MAITMELSAIQNTHIDYHLETIKEMLLLLVVINYFSWSVVIKKQKYWTWQH